MIPDKLRYISPIISLIVLCATVITAQPGSDENGKPLRLRYGQFDPLAQGAPPAITARSAISGESDEPEVWVFQFKGSAGASIREALENRGLRIRAYVPEDAYLVEGSGDAIRDATAMTSVRWAGKYSAELKVRPDLLSAPAARREPLHLELEVWKDRDSERVLEELAEVASNVKVRRTGNQGDRILFTATPEDALRVASLSEVHWIERAPRLTRRMDLVRPVVQSNTSTDTPLYDNGLFGEGQIVGHIDGDIEIEHCLFRDDLGTTNTPNIDHRKVIAYYGGDHPSDMNGTSHGTATAAVIAGQIESAGITLDKAGVAPAARLVHSYDLDVEGFGNLPPSTLRANFELHQGDGAFIHTNSWGDDFETTYTLWCKDIDSYSYDNEDALVIFAATNQATLRTPENAKNCLAVGASREFPNTDDHRYGGIGPTVDGRRKPEIYAPGQNTNTADAFGATDCSVANNSGTSFAAPAIAGAAALVREYFMEGYYPTGAPNAGDELTPTGSLLKATLLNSTRDMTAVLGYPSDLEGWGLLVADDALYFPGDQRKMLVFDARHADGLTLDTNLVIPVRFNVLGTSEPLRVTLVWADPAAELAVNDVLVNDLDLTLNTPSSTQYKGNVFFSGESATGGVYDRFNNVEQILINVPQTGEYSVKVEAAQLPTPPQGFAVVVSGQVENITASSSVANQLLAPPKSNGIVEEDTNRDGLFDAADILVF